MVTFEGNIMWYDITITNFPDWEEEGWIHPNGEEMQYYSSWLWRHQGPKPPDPLWEDIKYHHKEFIPL